MSGCAIRPTTATALVLAALLHAAAGIHVVNQDLIEVLRQSQHGQVSIL
jgi:hypothetical protein